MDPTVWGPHMWFGIHSIALGYPDAPSSRDRDNYRAFFNNLDQVLPCQTCADHYKQYVISNSLKDEDMASADALFAWTVRLHNAVNKRLGKKEISVAEARSEMSSVNSRNHATASKSDSGMISILCIGAVIGAAIGVGLYMLMSSPATPVVKHGHALRGGGRGK